MATFGENLRKLRKSRGYSQQKFAEIIDSNQVNVSTWELGTRMPSLATIRHIADTFKVPLSSLISMEDSEMDEDFVQEIADLLRTRPAVRSLLDMVRYMTDSDLNAVLGVASAIIGKARYNEQC